MILRPSFLLLACLAAAAPAQDLIALNFAGEVFALDSATGQGVRLGSTGAVGHNSLVKMLNATLFTTSNSGTATAPVFHLEEVDRQSGALTRRFSNLAGDLRGLAGGRFGTLFGVVDGGRVGDDQFARISTIDGSLALIASLGLRGVQALTRDETVTNADVFFAWDLTAGLVRVTAAGVVTDVNPQLGATAPIQFLTMHEGRLLGGQHELYSLDPATGATTLIGSGGYSDLRGCETRNGVYTTYGRSCAGASGSSALTFTGAVQIGQSLTIATRHHTPNAPAVLLFGLSRTHLGSLPLPFTLDPLLGTVGCDLLVSMEVTGATSTDATGALSFRYAMTPLELNVQTFHLQMGVLEPVPGNLSLSNGVSVRTGR